MPNDSSLLSALDAVAEYEQLRMQLCRLIQDGHLQLTKTRYASGADLLSTTKLPAPNINTLTALTKVDVVEGEVPEFSLSQGDESQTVTMIRNRKLQKDVEAKERKEKEKKEGKKEKDESTSELIEVPSNPLEWYGLLAPTSLQHAQNLFNHSIELCVDIANIQAKASAKLRECERQDLNEKGVTFIEEVTPTEEMPPLETLEQELPDLIILDDAHDMVKEMKAEMKAEMEKEQFETEEEKEELEAELNELKADIAAEFAAKVEKEIEREEEEEPKEEEGVETEELQSFRLEQESYVNLDSNVGEQLEKECSEEGSEEGSDEGKSSSSGDFVVVKEAAKITDSSDDSSTVMVNKSESEEWCSNFEIIWDIFLLLLRIGECLHGILKCLSFYFVLTAGSEY